MQSNSYIAGSGLYYSFDPRAKIIFTVLISVTMFLPVPHIYVYAMTAALFLLSLLSVKAKATMRSLSLIAPMLLFMAILMPFQHRGGDVIFSIHSFPLLTSDGLSSFLIFASRFVFISLCCSLFMQTTKSRDILPSLRFFHLPISASLTLSMAMRFIPDIGSTYREIRDSQRLRLPNPDQGNARKRRFRSMLPTLISTLVVEFKDIPFTASALEMRGYGRKNPRTSFYALPSAHSKAFHFALALLLPVALPLIFIYLVK